MFSKSFGYAVRGVLYIAVMQDTKRYIQAEEISQQLTVPRHFMSKILKKLAKDGVISSIKGPAGGFTTNEKTLGIPLIEIFEKTEGLNSFNTCVLRLKECNPELPCPLHNQMDEIRNSLSSVLVNTTIDDLLKKDKEIFLKSISSITEINLNFNGSNVKAI